MLLNDGELDGVRVLTPYRLLSQMPMEETRVDQEKHHVRLSL
jgi:hypothetical protein